MSDISESGWKRALDSILEELDEQEYKKMLGCCCFDKIPKGVKARTKPEEMPQLIIQHLGVDGSISAINEAMDLIPRKDPAVQDLLLPFVDKLKNKDQLKSSQPDKWKTSLTSILEQLDDPEYRKMLSNLDKIPKGLKTSKSKEEMPQIIIQHYGVEESVRKIKEMMDLIPRKDAAVQNLLRPFIDQQKKKDETTNKAEEPGGQSSKPGSSGTAGSSTGATGEETKAGDKHFVDEHRPDLTQRVTNINPILDELLADDLITSETYSNIRAPATSQGQMRELYKALNAGDEIKDAFYNLLEKYERCLVRDIKKKTKRT